MKRFNLWILVAILSCGLLTTSCSESDNPVPVRELSNSIDALYECLSWAVLLFQL